MKLTHIAIFSIALAGLCSCSSIRHTSAVAPVETSVLSFTVADMEVSPTKITKTTSWSYNPFKRVSIETVKTNTTAIMLQEANADALVESEYII